MPAPAVYVLAIVGTIGAAIAFKEFVYEPHIAPRIEKWAAEFVAQREAKRRQRQGPTAVPVAARPGDSSGTEPDDEDDDDNRPLGLVNRGSRLRRRRMGRGNGNTRDDSVELENLVAREVREWRSEVDRSSSSIRKKTTEPSSVLDESVKKLTYIPMSPTHVLMDSSAPLTPSTVPSLPSPNPDKSTDPTSLASSPPSPSPMTFGSVPSLSQIYPPDLDHEHGLELLSPPSSRADTPFTAVSPILPPSPPLRVAPLALPPNSLSSSDRTFRSLATASPSQATSQYLSFSASQPHSLDSNSNSATSSPVQVHLAGPSPSPLSPSGVHALSPSGVHALSPSGVHALSPSGVDATSPALTFSTMSSPAHTHNSTAELSDLDFFSDQEDRVLSDRDDRSEAGWSDSSWAFGGTRGGGGGGGGSGNGGTR